MTSGTLAEPVGRATLDVAVAPTRLRWTAASFERAVARGAFDDRANRLELLDGEIYEKMTQNGPHATATTLCAEVARALCAASTGRAGAHVRVQLPLVLGEASAPEPDVAIVSGGPRLYRENHPTSALLVIEVSDATLAFDRSVKAGVYARVGVPDYWIVNLRDQNIAVHRNAITESDGATRYENVTVYAPGDAITSLFAPDAPVLVADLLP